MSRLEELIQEYCPNGVEYKKLGEVANYFRGVTYKKSDEIQDLKDSHKYWKVLRANNITLSTNTINFEDVRLIKETVKIHSQQQLKTGDILLCAGSGSKAHIGKAAYIFEDIDYTFGGFMAVVRTNTSLNSRFLFHILTSSLFTSHLEQTLNTSTINNLKSSIINLFIIPLPPLPVQEEIVRILDKFTALEAELEAELEARKKQYEYCRVTLFQNVKNIELTRLDQISENLDSLRKPITKSVRTIGVYPYYGASGIVDYVKDYLFDENLLLISEDGANLLSRVTPIAFSVAGKYWVNNHAHVLKFGNIATQKYVEHYLNSIDLTKYINTAAQPKITQANLNSITIPLPPLAEQERIVSILDRFDALVNDITQGLPAEIEARRKQYEYYRNQLLTFKEATP